MKLNWLITDHNITVNFGGQTHTIARVEGEELTNRLMEAIKSGQHDKVPALVDAALRVKKFSHGHFEVKDGDIFVKGAKVSSYLGNKILKFANEGLPYLPLVKFAEKLNQNPSHRAVNELFEFLDKNDHPITEEGNFVAYKKVRDTFMDVHSNTMLNAVGTVVKMPRNAVNEDKTQTCSAGLHCSSWEYATNFYPGAVMLEVEVNPAHVVAVPIDYNSQKMRVCEYRVVAQVDREHSTGTQLKNTNTGYDAIHHVESDFDIDDDDSDYWENEDSDEDDLYPSEDVYVPASDETEEDLDSGEFYVTPTPVSVTVQGACMDCDRPSHSNVQGDLLDHGDNQAEYDRSLAEANEREDARKKQKEYEDALAELNRKFGR